ncbi:hypothetical protein CC1G_11358 [Coprinopsis cinerea okayama7|uniref:Transmembrane protein n=1 Tax=Coprinopsis cinerea (strain Okayama-7 / 130 / ATCC MYA-4618 / FGSC 9003) TaxID=240176 RepID=A8P8W1_COPC7|nr:hypothetical protein CC1G_11358 [Coprinopsis cinerea okayama7\|eukprot:XP_001839647.2 hypothetical protein CC1G_11358 [Coprinopsis cinerea okayama7\
MSLDVFELDHTHQDWVTFEPLDQWTVEELHGRLHMRANRSDSSVRVTFVGTSIALYGSVRFIDSNSNAPSTSATTVVPTAATGTPPGTRTPQPEPLPTPSESLAFLLDGRQAGFFDYREVGPDGWMYRDEQIFSITGLPLQRTSFTVRLVVPSIGPQPTMISRQGELTRFNVYVDRFVIEGERPQSLGTTIVTVLPSGATHLSELAGRSGSPGALVGAVVGSVVALVLVLLVSGWWILKRRRKRRRTNLHLGGSKDAGSSGSEVQVNPFFVRPPTESVETMAHSKHREPLTNVARSRRSTTSLERESTGSALFSGVDGTREKGPLPQRDIDESAPPPEYREREEEDAVPAVTIAPTPNRPSL